ncbi:MAG: F0F1 ATP synthase subunit B [Phycisphaeraceae bacterium]
MKRLCIIVVAVLALGAGAWAAPQASTEPDPAAHAASPGDAAEHHVATSPMAGSIAQSVAAAIVFLILLVVLYKMAWNPILKGLQDREGKIKADLEQAQKANDQAKATLAGYQEQLAKARDESAAIIAKGRGDAERIAAQLKDETQNEITEARKRAQAEIRFAKEQALADLYKQVARLSTGIAGRIIHREIRPEDQHKLVEEAMSAMEKTEV